jgi:hypothetical protein
MTDYIENGDIYREASQCAQAARFAAIVGGHRSSSDRSMGVPAEHDRAPAWRKIDGLEMDLSPRISPMQVHAEPCSAGQMAYPKVQVGAGLPGKPVPAVHLSDESPSVGKVDRGSGADRCPAPRVTPRMTMTDSHRSRVERLEEMESQKRADMRTLITVERRVPPHIRHGEVQSTIAIHISDSNTSTHLWFMETQLWSNIRVSAIWSSHIEWVVLVATNVGTWLKHMVESGIVYERFTAQTQFL